MWLCYRITPDGVWDQLWESRDDSPYDLTFADNNSLLFTENVDNDTVYSGDVSTGIMSALALPGSIPNAAGVVIHNSNVYVIAANNPGNLTRGELHAYFLSAGLSDFFSSGFGKSAGLFLFRILMMSSEISTLSREYTTTGI